MYKLQRFRLSFRLHGLERPPVKLRPPQSIRFLNRFVLPGVPMLCCYERRGEPRSPARFVPEICKIHSGSEFLYHFFDI